jgi:hypothetical protein
MYEKFSAREGAARQHRGVEEGATFLQNTIMVQTQETEEGTTCIYR